MPTRLTASLTTSPGDLLTRRARGRALLARQLLLARAPHSAAQAVGHLLGMQAQAPIAPYVGLWTRLAAFGPDDLSGLITGRAAVRIVVMRGTLHLITADDCRTLRPLTQPVLDRSLTGHRRSLAGVDVDAVAEAGRSLVEERPRALGEIGADLARRWPGTDPRALAAVVRVRVPLVQLPPRGVWGQGGQAVHTSAENWLGRPLHPGPDPEELALRYLAAYGPATAKDLQVWSGLTRQRTVFDRLRPRLRVFRDENGAELLDLPDAPRPGPDTPAPPRFLPEYDNLLRSHADRGHVLPDEHRARLATPNDAPRPVFLLDGVVAGTWKITQDRERATLTVEPFAPPGRRDREALAEEGERLLGFVAPDAAGHDIRFTG